MTPVLLITSLAKEIEKICSHMKFLNTKNEYQKINVYEYSPPIPGRDEDDTEFRPCIVVSMMNGESIESNQHVDVMLSIELADYQKSTQLEKDALNIINDITERFKKNPILNNKYVAEDKITWVVQEEDIRDTYPFFYAAMHIAFNYLGFQDEGSIYT